MDQPASRTSGAEPQKVDTADRARRDPLSQGYLFGRASMIISVTCRQHRAQGAGIAGLHHTVDYLVVATVAADRHHHRRSRSCGRTSQLDRVASMLGRHQVDRQARYSTPQFIAKLLGALLNSARALRVEDQNHTIKREHHHHRLRPEKPWPLASITVEFVTERLTFSPRR